jgi:hypothetical protein
MFVVLRKAEEVRFEKPMKRQEHSMDRNTGTNRKQNESICNRRENRSLRKAVLRYNRQK